jgi:hypothetical protein
MKNPAFYVFTLLLVTACASDRYSLRSPDLSNYTIDNPKTHKVWFESIPDADKTLECGLPAAGTIKGHCSLMGDIIPEKSPFTIWHWYWDPKSPDRKLVESIEGTITGTNGDSYYYTGIINYDIKRESFTGVMYINGGIGKLDGIIGECYMKGNVRDGISMWSSQGTIAMSNENEK